MGLFSDEKGPALGRHIRGVSCDVKNCVYHDGDNCCTAERITVGPSYASCGSDTVCATFRAKSSI